MQVSDKIYEVNRHTAEMVSEEVMDFADNADTEEKSWWQKTFDKLKNAGADIKERKITLPLLCAMEAAPEEGSKIRSLIDGIETSLEKNGSISEPEKQIISSVNEFVQKYNGIEKAQEILERHVAIASEALSILPQSNAKERLLQLVQYVGKRNV
jgi:geranylgeranyl pyrophosphate synthase